MLFRWARGRMTDEDRVHYEMRGRAKSNFLKQSEIHHRMAVNYNVKDNIITANKASESLDVLWKNMGVINAHVTLLRVIIFIVSIVMVIFLSSPAALLASLKKIDPTELSSMEWTKDMGPTGKALQKSIPPLVIISINFIIITVLDYASVLESYDTHS